MTLTDRRDADTQFDWPRLQALLDDDDRRAAVLRRVPGESRESYLAALRRVTPTLAEETLSWGRRLQTASKLTDRPTVAVAGMLNAGKTSLVSSFLSPAGRTRTLRGTGNDAGTHRFVLWLPSAWRADSELWHLLLGQLSESLGRAPEELAVDPAAASAQYNNRSGGEAALGVPLLATDPALDDVGLGLLDCPDIVSDEAFGLGSPARRRELLAAAATFCSGFLVVTDASSSRDATLADLLRIAAELMPGVPRMLAVNRVRPRQSPDSVLETFSPMMQNYGVGTLFAAYDYEIPAAAPFIPGGVDIEGENEPTPVFFEVSPDADANPPASIPDERLMASLPSRLDPAQMNRTLDAALQTNLRRIIWRDGLSAIRDAAAESADRTRRCQQVLLDAATDFFTHRRNDGVIELRLHQSERIVRQLSDSFVATAPVWARWGMRLSATMRNATGGVRDLLKGLNPTAAFRRTSADVRDRLQSGDYGELFDAESFVEKLDRFGGTAVLTHLKPSDGGGSLPVDREELIPPVHQAIMHFERSDLTTLDPRRLDAVTREMWASMSLRDKLTTGLTPVATLVLTFGAVLMIPIDFGHSAIFAASFYELMGAAGITGIVAAQVSGEATKKMSATAAAQQLSDFHAALCDCLGLARPEPPPTIRLDADPLPLPPPKMATLPPTAATLPLRKVRDEFLDELGRLLPRGDA